MKKISIFRLFLILTFILIPIEILSQESPKPISINDSLKNNKLLKTTTNCELSFNISDFMPVKNKFFLNGSSIIYNSSLRLTSNTVFQHAASWYKDYIPVGNGFETVFSFRISEGDDDGVSPDGSSPGADGFAFVIQNTGLNVMGDVGPALGYYGIQNSIAIELDLFNNSQSPNQWNDPNGNHLAVQSGGKSGNSSAHNNTYCLGITSNIPKINSAGNGTIYYMKIDYNVIPNKLRIYLDADSSFVAPVLTIDNLNLKTLLKLNECGKAYMGFTSSTGNAYENHDILSWSVCGYPLVANNLKIIGDSVICEGKTGILRVNGNYQSYQWSNGSTTNSMTFDSSGRYSVTVIDSIGCTQYNEIDVRVLPSPNPILSVNCKGDSITLEVPDTYADYEWYNDPQGNLIQSGSYKIVIKNSGVYYVKVKDQYGCDGISNKVKIDSTMISSNLSILSVLNNGRFDMGIVNKYGLICKDIKFINSSTNTIIIDSNVFLKHNIDFSIPQSQFPLIVQPSATFNINVCFSPLSLGTLLDTLVIQFSDCNKGIIPLFGKSIADTILGISRCIIPINFISKDASKHSVVITSYPYPNPTIDLIKIPFKSDTNNINDISISYKIFNVYGEIIKESNKSTILGTNYEKNIKSGEIVIDLIGLNDNIYFLTLICNSNMYYFPIYIRK